MAPGRTGTFAYFAFGSNMLKERLHLENPSATYLDTGRLKDYQLDFGVWGRDVENSWHGGVATILESPGSEVWGVVWTLDRDHQDTLDKQEGVHAGIYSPLEVRVESSKHGEMLCRSYQMNNFHARPTSPQYKHFQEAFLQFCRCETTDAQLGRTNHADRTPSLITVHDACESMLWCAVAPSRTDFLMITLAGCTR